MNRFFERIFAKKVPATGLAVFRILFFTNLLLEVFHIFTYRKLIFDRVPFLESSEIALTIPLCIWMISLVFIVFGLFTRWATVINYLLILVYMSDLDMFEYHMDYVYTGLSLMVIFLPIDRVMSLDRLRRKIRFSSSKQEYEEERTVRVYAYFLPVLFGLGVVYADSVLYKITSPMWMEGLGMWLPASITQITICKDQFILNQEWLVRGLGYLTVLFETIFIFTFWFKPFRIPFLLIGIGLHIGIYIEFPIPYFALGSAFIYVLMFPFSWWRRIGSIFNRNSEYEPLHFYYDAECPLCLRTKWIIEYFDFRSRVDFVAIQSLPDQHELLKENTREELLDSVFTQYKGNTFEGLASYREVFKRVPAFWIFLPMVSLPGLQQVSAKVYRYIADARDTERCNEENCGLPLLRSPYEEKPTRIFRNLNSEQLEFNLLKYGVLILLIFQINVSLFSPYPKQWTEQMLSHLPERIQSPVNSFHNGMEAYSRKLIGITRHPVFMDGHFNKIRSFAVEYQQGDERILLPMTSAEGLPGEMLSGGTFVHWTFRVCYSQADDEALIAGLKRYTAYWLMSTGRGVEGQQRFRVTTRSDRPVFKWEKDLLTENLNRPWEEWGEVVWVDGEFDTSRQREL
ncbi:MAG: DUF393 domain-containing protein [Flavobacteriales bacterium]|nr:DUF393 domain-containing protein [Flavobacteriales bacterium]